MKKELERFYSENPGLFEIVGALFVISGLFLNIHIEGTRAKEAIQLVQFFLLVGSCGALGLLLLTAIKFLFEVLSKIPATMTATSTSTTGPKNQPTLRDAKNVLAIILILLFGTFLTSSIVYYLYLAYFLETILLLIAVLCYFLSITILKWLIESLPAYTKLGDRNFIATASLFLVMEIIVGIPVTSYIVITFFNPYELDSWYLGGTSSSIVCLLVSLIIIKKST
jgi:hypothetical protein